MPFVVVRGATDRGCGGGCGPEVPLRVTGPSSLPPGSTETHVPGNPQVPQHLWHSKQGSKEPEWHRGEPWAALRGPSENETGSVSILTQPIHSTLRPEAGSRPVFSPHCSKHLLLLPPWSPQPHRETPERPGPAPRGRGGSGLPGSWAQHPGRLTAGLAMTLSD